MDDRVIELHIDLARHDNGIIDGIRPMNTRRDPGRTLDDAKHGAVAQRRTSLAQSLVSIACVVDRKRFRSPHHTSRRTPPCRSEIFGNLIDLNDRAAVGVMSGDYSAKLKCHFISPSETSD